MAKDVVYIDTEDDITAIIGKIKDAKGSTVALVPPKQTSILQSTVNLRLIKRAAATAEKQVTLVTNDHTLIGLAAAAKIAVAKNLQQQAEVAEIPALAVDDDDDIIDGSELPIGELEKTEPGVNAKNHEEDLVAAIEREDTPTQITKADNPARTADMSPASDGKKPKVPNYKRFRRRLLLIIAAVIVVAGGLVWAIFIAPSAKIIITAKTSPTDLSKAVSLSPSADTSADQATLRTTTQSLQKTASVNFTATGTKTTGQKATGSITLSNSEDSSSVAVPAGSGFSNGNYTFVTTTSVVVPGAGVSGGKVVPGEVDVDVRAMDVGPEYNLSARSYQSTIDGVSAYGNQMSGGSKQTVKIVTADDVQKAGQALVDQSTDSVKKQLTSQFTKDDVVIDGSFAADRGDGQPSPAVGSEAPNGNAKLTSNVTYTMSAVTTTQLDMYLNDAFKAQLTDTSTQRVYNNGRRQVSFTNYKAGDNNTATVQIQTTGQIGPNIDEMAIKKEAKGKKFGDVQPQIEALPGVSSVDIKYSFFWVQKIPNDVNKISVSYQVKDGSN